MRKRRFCESCWTEGWTSVIRIGNLRHTLQNSISSLKVLQEALRAKCFVSVRGTLMQDLGFQSLRTTTRTNPKARLPNINAVYSLDSQGGQLPTHSPKISALNPSCKYDQLATYLLVIPCCKKSTRRKSEILFFNHLHSIILFSNSFTSNILKTNLVGHCCFLTVNSGEWKTCSAEKRIIVDIYMHYTLRYIHILVFLEYILSM